MPLEATVLLFFDHALRSVRLKALEKCADFLKLLFLEEILRAEAVKQSFFRCVKYTTCIYMTIYKSTLNTPWSNLWYMCPMWGSAASLPVPHESPAAKAILHYF